MYTFLSKKGQLLAVGLGVLLTAIYVLVVASGVGEYNMLSDDAKKQTNLFNAGLYSVIALIIICAVAWIAFALIQVVTHFKQSLRSIIGAAIILVIFLIVYSTVSGEATGSLAAEIADQELTLSQSKIISAGLITMLTLGGAAIVALIVGEIANLIK
jgi:O-antigen/teichoic acid export membrane protein